MIGFAGFVEHDCMGRLQISERKDGGAIPLESSNYPLY